MDFGCLRKLAPKKIHKKQQKSINLVLQVSFHQSLSLIINSNKVMMHNPPNFDKIFKLLQTVTTKSLLQKEFSFLSDSCE